MLIFYEKNIPYILVSDSLCDTKSCLNINFGNIIYLEACNTNINYLK